MASFSKAQKAWTIKQVVFSQITSDSKNQVTLGWKKVSKAQGYDIYRSDKSNSGFEKIASISSGSTLTYTDKGVKSGNTYYYKIAATYKIKGSAGRGSYSKVTEVAVLKQGSISSITLGDNNVLNISWNSVANASGYELAGAVSEKGTYTTLQTSGATSFTHSNLVQGTTYYYKVRAYKTVNKTKYYGAYSNVICSAKTPSKPVITVKNAGSKTLKVSWKKVSGANGYEIYRKSGSSAKYSIVQTVTSGNTLSYTNKKLVKNSKYYYKVRAYKTVKGNKANGKFSAVRKVKIKK